MGQISQENNHFSGLLCVHKNDQNNIIGRVVPKMNEDCQNECQAILLKNDPGNSFSNNSNPEFTVTTQEIYSNYLENEEIYSEVSSSDANCQTAESEVTDLKEWLILHNDLILQQNQEIVEKDDQIYLLQRENEMLKERLLCVEKGIPYEPKQDLSTENTIEDLLSEDMTQDSCGHYEEESKENLDGDAQQSDNVVTCSLEVNNFQVHHDNEHAESQVDTTIIDEDNFIEVEEVEFKDEYLVNNLSDTESDTAECTKDSFPEYNFTVNNFCEFDSMKNIKMSIKRKRVSSLSALTNNEPSLLEEKKTMRRAKKKRKRSGKDLEILTAKEPYFIHISNEETCLDPEPVAELPETTGLEVPRWRIKHYTSCYTMEGTENLDDEVFNKRHLRLEIDERRRKRWDVQRIREQRVIEKLKQRQDRIANGSKGEIDQDFLESLLPKVEDVKFLEIVDDLPVSSFGHLIPKSEPTNFSLTWLDNPSANRRRTNCKRSSSSRRRKRFRSTR